MISIKNLRFGYTEAPLLSLPEFQTDGTQSLLIKGNSGSGKTSLLFLLAGLLQPQAGEITLNGTSLTTLKPAARDTFRGQHIGFVFQQPHLVVPLTVLENVLLAPFMAGVKSDKAYAIHLLESLGLGQFLHRNPSELSHGQQQRVGVARALAHKPALILADEPTSALDDAAAEATIQLLTTHAANASAQLVIASHDARITAHFPQILQLGATS